MSIIFFLSSLNYFRGDVWQTLETLLDAEDYDWIILDYIIFFVLFLKIFSYSIVNFIYKTFFPNFFENFLF